MDSAVMARDEPVHQGIEVPAPVAMHFRPRFEVLPARSLRQPGSRHGFEYTPIFSAGPGKWPLRLRLRNRQRAKKAAQVPCSHDATILRHGFQRFTIPRRRTACFFRAPGPASATLRANRALLLQRTLAMDRLACNSCAASSQLPLPPTSRARRPRAYFLPAHPPRSIALPRASARGRSRAP